MYFKVKQEENEKQQTETLSKEPGSDDADVARRKKSENKILVIKEYVFTMLYHLPNDFPVKNIIGKIRQLLVSIFRRQPNLKQEVRTRKFESSKSTFNQRQLFLELIAGGTLKYTHKFIMASPGFPYIRHVPSKNLLDRFV